jgi:hypothetical protein
MYLLHVDFLQVCPDKKYMNFVGVLLPQRCDLVDSIQKIENGRVFFSNNIECMDVQ